MRYLGLFLVCVAILASGCNRVTKTAAVPVINVANDDQAMKAAIEKARATLPDFVRALQAPKPTQRGFAIKAPITDGKHTEHMWLNQVTFDGTKYHGTINNVPDKVTGVKLGSKRSFDPQQLSDWMYIDNRKLVGGFTVRVLRDQMGKAERENFERNSPFEFD